MKRLNTTLMVVTAVLTVAVVAEAVYLGRLRKEVSVLRLEVEQVREASAARSAPAPAVERSESPVLTPRSRRAPAPVMGPASVRPAPSATTLPSDLDAQIELLVERKMEEKFEELKPKKKDPKPPLEKIAQEQEWDLTTQTRVKQVLDAAKDETFTLLSTARKDGGSFVNDFLEAARSDNPNVKAGAIWMRLFQEKVPGRDDTYAVAVMGIQERTNSRVRDVLLPDQWPPYKDQQYDPLQINTGYNPFKNYVVNQGVKWPEDW